MNSSTWLAEHQKKRDSMNFAIINPWTDKMCYKTGICDTYICSTITEILHISAEQDASTKLNNPNPDYHKIVKQICAILSPKNKTKKDDFPKLVALLREHTTLKSTAFQAWPYKLGDVDIRALDTIDECLTFIYTFCLDLQKN